MKKVYEAPAVEKVEFQYRDQVVAQSGCQVTNWVQDGVCVSPEEQKEYTNR